MTRKEQIRATAVELAELEQRDFIQGAEWADANPDTTVDAFKVLESKLAVATEALKFECGDRCAEQNPCNAKEVLRKLSKPDVMKIAKEVMKNQSKLFKRLADK